MLNRNDPARRGEAVECLLGSDNHGHSALAVRTEVLTRRFHLTPARALMLAGLAWGGLNG